MKRNKKKYIIVFSTLILTAIIINSVANAMGGQPDNRKLVAHNFDKNAFCDNGYCSPRGSNKNWMSRISDNARPMSLSIPGTHDSMAHTMKYDIINTFGEDKIITQTMTMKSQLESGIRYIDMRTKIKNGKFAMYHGIAFLDNYFDSVLDDLNSFLSANPSEFVLMRLKNEGDDSQADYNKVLSNNYFNNSKYSHLFYRDKVDSSTTVNQIRGKVILLKDFRDENNDFGVNFYLDAKVQDHYEVDNHEWGLYTKMESVVNFMDETQNKGDYKWEFYLNHLSGTGKKWNDSMTPWRVATGFPGYKTWDNSFRQIEEPLNYNYYKLWPEENGKRYVAGTNVVAMQQIRINRWRQVGVIIMDYPGAELINTIIDSNIFKTDPSSYKMNYNGGSGSVRDLPVDSKSYYRSQKTKISSLVPKKEGYRFVGWEYVGNDYPYILNSKTWQPGEDFEVYKDGEFEAIWERDNRKFSIKFDSTKVNASGIPNDSSNVSYNELYKVPNYEPSADGYKFLKWEDLVTGKAYLPDDSIDVIENLNLDAVWEFLGLNIEFSSYEPNTTNIPTKITGLALNTAYTLPTQVPQVPGKQFDTWVDKITGQTYKPGGLIGIDDKNIQLVAKWKTSPQTVEYIGGDDATNVPIDSNTYYENDLVTLSNNIPIRDGFEFIAWEYSNHGYASGSQVKMKNEKMTLTARWKRIGEPSLNLNDTAQSSPGLWIYIGD